MYISIADAQHVWIGTIQEMGDPYSMSVKTTNGGNSWELDSIPVPGSPVCAAISSVDSNTCYYLFIDNDLGEGTIWKTTDGGESWINTISNQFVDGFANAVQAFDADNLVAMGDPNGGYFEIQLSSDGGVTWERVPSSNVPASLTNEYGTMGCYAAYGNSVWFTTNKGRCFRSEDNGVHWEVTEVVPSMDGTFYVCFSTELNGAFWQGDEVSSTVYITQDGGVTWTPVSFPSGYVIMNMSPVAGFEEGFVVTAWHNYTDVFFTPNLFSNVLPMDESLISMGSVAFLDPSTGWLGGGESGTNQIYKFNGIITAAGQAQNEEGTFAIIPNPAVSDALVKLPASLNSMNPEIRILDISGRLIDRVRIFSTDWTTLNAAVYQNGIYLVEYRENHQLLATQRWIVQH